MPTFFDTHSRKNILREWCSYLETVVLENMKIMYDILNKVYEMGKSV